MTIKNVICLTVFLGIAFSAAKALPVGQSKARSAAQPVSSKAVSQPVHPLSTLNGRQNAKNAINKSAGNISRHSIPSSIGQASSHTPLNSPIAKARESAHGLKKEAAESNGATLARQASGPLQGHIERKKPSGLKELIKDEFDGPIHPISTNNKNL